MTICLGKSCSFGLPCVPFIVLNCRQFSYFPFGFEGYGILLYQFLIIAYLFTLYIKLLHVDSKEDAQADMFSV